MYSLATSLGYAARCILTHHGGSVELETREAYTQMYPAVSDLSISDVLAGPRSSINQSTLLTRPTHGSAAFGTTDVVISSTFSQ